MKLKRFKTKKENDDIVEKTYECKNCGDEITKYEYKNNNKLCSNCIKSLYDEFGTGEE